MTIIWNFTSLSVIGTCIIDLYSSSSPLKPVELPKYVLKDSSELPLKGEWHLSIKSDVLGGELRFIKVPIDKLKDFLEFIKGL